MVIEKNNSDKIMLTFEKAEKALREIIGEGSRVSQSAVEKRAGLSNGALNYDVPMYRDLKARIQLAKDNKAISNSGIKDESNDRRLKDKYRQERDDVRSELKKARGEVLELRSALFDMQQYLKYLEKQGIGDINVVRFKSRKTDTE